jgi:hypothetical protein
VNSLVRGIGVEVKELSVVGVLVAAMVPGYAWVRKAPSANQVIGRSAAVLSAMLAAAVVEGVRRRK